jgi:hypothetical protein
MNTATVNSDTAPVTQLQARAHALRLSCLLAHRDQVVCDSARLACDSELLGWDEVCRVHSLMTAACLNSGECCTPAALLTT